MRPSRQSLEFILAVLILVLLLVACRSEAPTLEYTAYLTGEIPPCTPVANSSVDPCEPDLTVADSGSAADSVVIGLKPRGMNYFLHRSDSSLMVTHLVLRATYLPGTVRCIAREGIFRHHPYVDEEEFRYYSGGSRSLHCYADVRVNEYILGSGPSVLTVLVDHEPYDPLLNPNQVATWRRQIEEILIEGGRNDYIEAPDGGIEGREAVLFVGPAYDVSTEAWEVFWTWYVERREDVDTVVAVHPLRDFWRVYVSDRFEAQRSLLEIELPAFKQAVMTAHQARVTANGGRAGPDITWPTLETDANRLTQFYTTIGVYAHPDGPPSQPPPACGLAVTGEQYNPGLMLDCRALLAAKDALRGTGQLTWGTGTAIGSWEGVTVAGTPARVTKVVLPSKSLTGIIPPVLEDLLTVRRESTITHLDLSNNQLTGEIPRALGWMDNLVEVRLSGNSLTGCIPYGLKDVTTNDLSSLNLLYCPPAPDAPTGGEAGSTSLPLSWPAAGSTTEYRVEYREGIYGPWTLDDESITTTVHTVDGLLCKTEHQFRLSTYGDGIAYGAAWSDPSEPLKRTTGSCTPPVFGAASYSFSVVEDADIDSVIGTVAASDDSGKPVVYDLKSSSGLISAYDFFTLNEETGELTLAADLNRRAGAEANFTVAALDQDGGEATAKVTVEVLPANATAVPLG